MSQSERMPNIFNNLAKNINIMKSNFGDMMTLNESVGHLDHVLIKKHSPDNYNSIKKLALARKKCVG